MGKKKQMEKDQEKKAKIKKEPKDSDYDSDGKDDHSDDNNYKEDDFVVNDNEGDEDGEEGNEKLIKAQIKEEAKEELENESLGSSDLEIIPSSIKKEKKKKLKKKKAKRQSDEEPNIIDYGYNSDNLIEERRPNPLSHDIFKYKREKKEKSSIKQSMSKIYSIEELEREYATPTDNKIKLLDYPERLQLQYKQEDDLSKLKLDIDSEIDWLLEKIKIQLSSIDSIQNMRKKIGQVLELYKKDFFDIPYIVHIKRPIYESELAPNDVWKLYELDREWQTMNEYKQNVRKQFNVIRRFLSEKEGDFMEKRHIDSAKSIEELSYMEKYISFFKDLHIEEIKQSLLKSQSKVMVQLRPVRRSMAEDAKKNNIIIYAKRFSMTSHDLAINLELILKNESINILIPAPEPFQSPSALAEEYLNIQYNEVIKVMTQACKYLGLEMSSHPFIRHFIFNYFKANCFISTEPTNKGSIELDVFHSSFRTKRIVKKPINLFTNDLFLDIIQNEDKGLIKILISVNESDDELKDVSNRLLSAYMPQANNNIILSDNQKGWKIMREEAIRILINDYLLPQFQSEIKQELQAKAEKYVINECANCFYNLLFAGPYLKYNQNGNGNDNDNNNQMNERLFDETNSPKTISFVFDQSNKCSYCVLLSENGEVLNQYAFYHLADRQYRNINPINQKEFETDQHTLRDIILEFKPDLIVIGTNDIQCRTLRDNIISCEPSLMKADEGMPSVWVTFGDLMIPRIYSNSSISDKDFPNCNLNQRQAISLGRLKQNPMEEILQLWNEDNSRNSCLKINLHPLQRMVDQTKLAHALEIKAIQITNLIGIELNRVIAYPHLRGTLPFISGLGPRKAQFIIEKIVQSQGITKRVELVAKKIIGKKIMLNCNSFIKIKPSKLFTDCKYDLLDMTRIPIELYPLTKQIIKSAVEDDDDDNDNDNDNDDNDLVNYKQVMLIIRYPKKLDVLDLNEYIKKQSESNNQTPSSILKYMIQLIKRELSSPFKDPRKDYKDLTPSDLFQLLVGDDNMKLGHITIAKVIKVDDQTVRCRLMNDLEASLWIKDIFDENEKGSFDLMKERYKEGACFEARIKSINDTLFRVDLITKPTVMMSHKNYINTNDLHYFDLKDEDYLNLQYQLDIKEDNHKYLPRKIKHDKFRNITYQGSIESLRQKEIGDCIFRPSNKGINNLTLSYKFYRHTYSHIDIIEENKEAGMAIGSKLKIGHEVYLSLNDIIDRFVVPIKKIVNEIIQSRKFIHVDQLEEMEAKLSGDYKNDPSIIHYYLTIIRTFPLYVLLCYITKSNSVTTEYIKVKANGLSFHDGLFQDIDELITYFKKSYGTNEYSDYVKNQKPPLHEYVYSGDNKDHKVNTESNWNEKNEKLTCRYCHSEGHLIVDCPKKGGRGNSFINEKRSRSPDNDWGSNDNWGQLHGHGQWGSSDTNIKEKKKGCFNCGEDGHMSYDCPNPKKERKVMKCFNCNEEGHLSKDCPNPKKERQNKCFNCGEDGHMSRDCPNPKKERTMKCFNCNGEGHSNRDCPNPKKERSNKCFNCGEDGHMSRDCPNPKKERAMKCYNCNEEGHTSRDCPNPKKERQNKCFNCGEDGHMSRDCPNPKTERGSNNSRGGGVYHGNQNRTSFQTTQNQSNDNWGFSNANKINDDNSNLWNTGENKSNEWGTTNDNQSKSNNNSW